MLAGGKKEKLFLRGESLIDRLQPKHDFKFLYSRYNIKLETYFTSLLAEAKGDFPHAVFEIGLAFFVFVFFIEDLFYFMSLSL